jgi:hypothetical protein
MMCLTTRKLSAVNSQGRDIKWITNSMFLKKGGNEKKGSTKLQMLQMLQMDQNVLNKYKNVSQKGKKNDKKKLKK